MNVSSAWRKIYYLELLDSLHLIIEQYLRVLALSLLEVILRSLGRRTDHLFADTVNLIL